MYNKIIIYFLLLLHLATAGEVTSPEEEQGVRYANRCEACKILASELEDRLKETGKSHDVIEIGYSVDDVRPKKRTEYRRSELRLLESMENVCDRVLEYNLHKERTDSTRFAKGMPETFKTLHGLVDKGVKVDLGIPYELWDKPPVEVTQMKTQCENMLEQYEDEISEWYFKLQDNKSLKEHLCVENILRADERQCLDEQLVPKIDDKSQENETEKAEKQKQNTKKQQKNKINKENAKGDKTEL